MPTLLLLRSALSKRWLLVVVVFVAVASATTVGVYLRKPVYESRAAVLVNVERLGVSVSRADVRQDVAVLQAVEAVTSQAEVVRSKDLIERVLDTLDPATFKGPPPRNPIVAKIVAGIDGLKSGTAEFLRGLRLIPPANERYERVSQIESNLTVSPVRQAQVIRIAFTAHTPEAARLVLQRLLDLYVGRAADNALETLRKAAAAILAQFGAPESGAKDLALEIGVELDRDVAGQLQMLLLVLADRNMRCLIEQHVRRLKDGIDE